MKRKLLYRYILIYIPMVVGGVLYCLNSINIVSSLLLFLGGYIAIKNTFDYRMVKKNVKKVSNCENTDRNINDGYSKDKMMIMMKRKRNIRVRKREKK